MNIINTKLLETLFGIRLKENSNEETDKNDIEKYDFDEISPIIPEKINNNEDEISLTNPKIEDFINVIDIDYKRIFKRNYNDLNRFKNLYDLNI